MASISPGANPVYESIEEESVSTVPNDQKYENQTPSGRPPHIDGLRPNTGEIYDDAFVEEFEVSLKIFFLSEIIPNGHLIFLTNLDTAVWFVLNKDIMGSHAPSHPWYGMFFVTIPGSVPCHWTMAMSYELIFHFALAILSKTEPVPRKNLPRKDMKMWLPSSRSGMLTPNTRRLSVAQPCCLGPAILSMTTRIQQYDKKSTRGLF